MLAMLLICKDRQQAGSYKGSALVDLISIYKTTGYFKFDKSLEHIAQSLRNLTGLNAPIASATLQQSQVIGDISQNVAQAAWLAHGNALTAERSSDAGKLMGQLAEQLNRLLVQFRV